MEHSEQQKREEMMMMLLLTKPVEEDPDRRRQTTTNDRTAALFCRLCSIIGKETEAVGTGAFDGRERRLRRFPY
jgi:hypothetical protein